MAGHLLLALSLRGGDGPGFAFGRGSGPTLFAAVLGSLALQVFLVQSEFLCRVLRLEPIGIVGALPFLALGFAPLLLLEIGKGASRLRSGR